ncbi:SsgA family sporulation/cell division regulator [Streptomyces sp. NPDC093594]|uniref:SsgA family sporulation/cell division regulator n=1 Tax=Streptomyces sp. NPDC093594 TaxID=3155305 RepID=UPI00344BDBF5
MLIAELNCILHLVISPRHTSPISARLSYRSCDPYSVHIDFFVPGRVTVSWVFARDLLAEGTVRPSGLGDVRIWPGGTGRSAFVCLDLSSPHGRARLTACASEVTSWVGWTYHLVPAGFESASLDLDGELSLLLGEVT